MRADESRSGYALGSVECLALGCSVSSIQGSQERIPLPVCCLFRMSNVGSQPLYRFGDEPGNPLKTLTFCSC